MILATHHSEPGGHAENQDCCLLSRHSSDPDCWFAAVADGQGGRAGAAEAARIACATVADQLQRQQADRLLQPHLWLGLLAAADQAVAAAPETGFCTLAALVLTESKLAGASSGDSAVVLFPAGQPMRILTSGQRKNPPVGSGSAEFVPFAAPLSPPWTVLLLTDGVWKYGGWEFLQRLDPRLLGEELIQLLRRKATLPGAKEPDTYRGLQDDFTLVVLQGVP